MAQPSMPAAKLAEFVVMVDNLPVAFKRLLATRARKADPSLAKVAAIIETMADEQERREDDEGRQ